MSDNSYIDTSYGTSIDALRGDALRERIAQAVNDVREQTPLAQSFTNFVTINLVANAQLAAGGTAAMSFLPDDIIDTAEIAGSNYINVGTLLPFYKEALPQIAYELHKNGKTWVLDPVAAGIGKTRTAILESFRMYPPTIVRGNASEIIALDAMWGLATSDSVTSGTRPAGVEAVDEVDAAIEAAQRMARHLAKRRRIRRRRSGDRRRAYLPTARRQRDDDEDHRRRLLVGRRDRNVSGGLRTAGRSHFRIVALQSRIRNRRAGIQWTGILPGRTARCPVECDRRAGGRFRNHRGLTIPPHVTHASFLRCPAIMHGNVR